MAMAFGTVRIFVHKYYKNIGVCHLIIEEIADMVSNFELEILLVEI